MCSTRSSKSVARMIARIGFGLSLAFVGFAHYLDGQFPESVGRGLGVLEPLGMAWGYILPGLMIVGGLLLAFGIYAKVAAYVSSIALASIPAGLMLKSAMGIPLDETMPLAVTALIWLLVLLSVTKGKCGSMCGSCMTGACACPACDIASAPRESAAKSSPAAPVATKNASPAPKKTSAKKKTGVKKAG